MDLVCACDGLFPLPVEEKAISGLSRKALGVLGCARGDLFPPACRGKGNFRAPPEGPGSLQRECLRRPFPSARRGNSYFSAPQEGPGSLRQECSRWPLPLPVEEKASSGLPRKALGVLSGSVRDVLFSLPVEEMSMSRGKISGLRWPFPPACRGKGRLMALVCACDGLSPLPVEANAVSWTWCAFVMGFSFCLSRKRALWTRRTPAKPTLKLTIPSACRGKGLYTPSPSE